MDAGGCAALRGPGTASCRRGTKPPGPPPPTAPPPGRSAPRGGEGRSRCATPAASQPGDGLRPRPRLTVAAQPRARGPADGTCEPRHGPPGSSPALCPAPQTDAAPQTAALATRRSASSSTPGAARARKSRTPALCAHPGARSAAWTPSGGGGAQTPPRPSSVLRAALWIWSARRRAPTALDASRATTRTALTNSPARAASRPRGFRRRATPRADLRPRPTAGRRRASRTAAPGAARPAA
mmetsp:Transcript_88345/g.254901  ORF Transcript_88345/g.254901 Transcript_88345/m.254901 type:complete len:240 (-) Transcript_88345:759-1478(-)